MRHVLRAGNSVETICILRCIPGTEVQHVLEAFCPSSRQRLLYLLPHTPTALATNILSRSSARHIGRGAAERSTHARLKPNAGYTPSGPYTSQWPGARLCGVASGR